MFRRHPLLSLATVAYLGVVGWITLRPDSPAAGDSPWLWRALRFFARHDLTDWITYSRVESWANVAMFLPVGIFFLLLFGRRQWYVGIIAGFALTCMIEFAQLFVPGRVSDMRDIVANTVGGLVGVVFALIATTPKALRLKAEARQRADHEARLVHRV